MSNTRDSTDRLEDQRIGSRQSFPRFIRGLSNMSMWGSGSCERDRPDRDLQVTCPVDQTLKPTFHWARCLAWKTLENSHFTARKVIWYSLLH